MYSFLIKLAHGFTLVPLVLAFKQIGIFTYIKTPKSLYEILNHTKLNSGYLNTGLKLLLLFSIIRKKNNKYYLYNRDIVRLINDDFLVFYNQSFNKILTGQKKVIILNKYASKIIKGWNIKLTQNELISGPFLIPIIFYLKFEKKNLNKLNSKKFQILKKILVSYNIVKITENKLSLTSIGEYLINNINTIGVAASYKKMLFNLSFLLKHDPKLFFNIKMSSENHVDRKLNIASSSSQHNKYFNEILKIIETIFSKKNYPKYIMDIGCGDGLLLKKIYNELQLILSKNDLKKIKMIGIDLNNISIKKAKKNLSNIPSIFIKGSIDNPELIFKQLYNKNIDPNLILHVRSFIDHERTIKFLGINKYNDRDIINKSDQDVEGIDVNGKIIKTQIINKSLDEFYFKWSKYIGKFGLINLEVFKQSFNQMKTNFDLNEGAHFDFIQIVSGQNLCKAKMQLYCMARNQLFPKVIKTYPESTEFKRIILGYFLKKRYKCQIIANKNKKLDLQFLDKKHKLLKLKKTNILQNLINNTNIN